MKHEVKKVNDTRHEVTVDVDTVAWKKAQDKAISKLSKNVEVPGFRAGKAPKNLLLEHLNPERIFNEALNTIIPEVIVDILKEEKDIHPLYNPSVSVTKLSDTDLQIVLTFIDMPTADIKDYKALGLKREAVKVTDEDVNESIKRLLENNADLKVVERESKNGDTITIDFKGYLYKDDGTLEAFEGGEAKNYDLVLGSHSFIPGFEEQLVGVKAGEDKDIDITFPTQYVKELAGKKAKFHITLHEVKEKEIPALTEDTIKDLGIEGVTDENSLKEHQKKTLLENKTREIDNAYYTSLIDKIVESATFHIDEEVLKNEVARQEEDLKKRLEGQGLTFEQYLEVRGIKEDDLKNELHAGAEKNFKRFLVEHAVELKEGLTATDSDLEHEAEEMAKHYNMKKEEILDIMNKSKAEWLSQVTAKKVHDYLLKENA